MDWTVWLEWFLKAAIMLLILLTGFTKKEDEAEPRDVDLAMRVMEEDRRLHGGSAGKDRR